MNLSDKIANEIFKTVDVIVDQKIRDTKFSSTIVCSIVERVKASDMYILNYQGQEVRGMSMGASYNPGDNVIVLLSDKTSTSTKFILGRLNDRTPTIVPSSGEFEASYTHIAYADSEIGEGMSLTDPNKDYLGIYVDSEPGSSMDPAKYKWSLVKGSDGKDAIISVISYPLGNTFKNSSQLDERTISVEIFEGVGEVLSGVEYNWFYKDATITSSQDDGYDDLGGIGWRKIDSSQTEITGYSTKEISVKASFVQSSQVFKAVIEYSGVNRTSMASLLDLTDPLQLSIIGDTILFDNDEGDKIVEAKLYLGGVEIENYSDYTYLWEIYETGKTTPEKTISGNSNIFTYKRSELGSKLTGYISCEVSQER